MAETAPTQKRRGRPPKIRPETAAAIADGVPQEQVKKVPKGLGKPRTQITINRLDTEPNLFSTLLDGMSHGVPMAAGEKKLLPKPWDVCYYHDLTYGGLLKWIQADPSGKRQERMKQALEIRGKVLAEEALHIADSVECDPRQAVAKAQLQVDTRFRLARAYTPQVFGPEVSVAPGGLLNIHIHADGGGQDALHGEAGEVVQGSCTRLETEGEGEGKRPDQRQGR